MRQLASKSPMSRTSPSASSRLLDSWNDAVEFAVRSPRGEIGQGLVDLPVEITFE